MTQPVALLDGGSARKNQPYLLPGASSLCSQPMPSLQQVVLVTGASSGFGRLIAETLARKNYQVFATMRKVNGRNAAAARKIRELAGRDSLSLEILELDVTDDASIDRTVNEVTAKCGQIDVLVNNAGYGIMGLAESVTLAQAQRLFDTNFFGVLRMNRAVLPAMKRQGSGLLLHVSSGAGRLVVPGMGMYCASKYAMEALAEAYRYELASQGIDSVVIEPGAYATPIMEKFERGDDPGRRTGYGEMAQVPEKVQAKIASSRANPQEIADAVLQIIETPAGHRQIRYRVGPGGPGVERINALTDEIQEQLLEAFGVTALAKFKTRSSGVG
jgi:NAD(P)-dependent dehydrogenase (short-subunit alcohol dehydrogenase family)